jgi:hypothetical protein
LSPHFFGIYAVIPATLRSYWQDSVRGKRIIGISNHEFVNVDRESQKVKVRHVKLRVARETSENTRFRNQGTCLDSALRMRSPKDEVKNRKSDKPNEEIGSDRETPLEKEGIQVVHAGGERRCGGSHTSIGHPTESGRQSIRDRRWKNCTSAYYLGAES